MAFAVRAARAPKEFFTVKQIRLLGDVFQDDGDDGLILDQLMAVEELDVQLVTDNQQTSLELAPGDNLIELR